MEEMASLQCSLPPRRIQERETWVGLAVLGCMGVDWLKWLACGSVYIIILWLYIVALSFSSHDVPIHSSINLPFIDDSKRLWDMGLIKQKHLPTPSLLWQLCWSQCSLRIWGNVFCGVHSFSCYLIQTCDSLLTWDVNNVVFQNILFCWLTNIVMNIW